MNNMRRGFTMIELIFVIVIIGILAAVAIPKLAGTAKEAKKSTYVSFLGTLNRTVGPSMWAVAVGKTSGQINGASPDNYDLSAYTEIPDFAAEYNLTACADGNQTTLWGKIYDLPADVAVSGGADGIYCQDGSTTRSPSFAFTSDGNKTF